MNNEDFETLKNQTIESIRAAFPVKDRLGQLEVHLKDVGVRDVPVEDEISAQLEHRLSGRTWKVPIQATVQVKDGDRVVMEKRLDIASLPRMTRHGTYIVGGQEKTVTNQWRLRPGIYVKSTEKRDEYEAQVQLAKGRAFDVRMDDGGALYMTAGGRKVSMYSVMKALGADDHQLETAWGAHFAPTKKKSSFEKDLNSLHTSWAGRPVGKEMSLVDSTRALFHDTKVDPVVVEHNVGVSGEHLSAPMLLATTTKLLDVAAKRREPDPIDSLQYKELWTAKDHILERLNKSRNEVVGRVQSVLGKDSVRSAIMRKDTSALRDVIAPDLLQKSIYSIFTTPLANVGKQTNPIAMLSDRSMVTITGPGGIQNDAAITASNTAIDPSHLGYLDPVFTPESDPGKTTHITYGTKIRDKKPQIQLYNTRTKRVESVDAAKAAISTVVLPDQITWKDGHPQPRGGSVRVSDKSGRMQDLPATSALRSADYVMLSPTQVFATETNLVPFMQNDSAGRTSMSARHMSQAISVVHREAPLVQVRAGKDMTFERLIGSSFLAHTAPTNGTVTEVTPDRIVIADSAGKPHVVGLYNHYPTNHDKGMLHSTPRVKVGDRVQAHQLLADNNYTKGGELALGVNLRAAYIANGANHEDGIVLSESAAAKLRSEHLHKPAMIVGPKVELAPPNKFQLAKSGVFTSEQLKSIGADGVIAVGTRVRPGDPLVLALGEQKPLSGLATQDAQRLANRLMNTKTNQSLLWDSRYEGTVVRVTRAGKELQVHVKTEEPAQVGSKISTRHSAKGIVAQILPDALMPRDSKGTHMEVLLNPAGVPGRQNAGQILETAAAKIALKTGKPYIVENFVGGTDYLAKIRNELKTHGISETEVLFDPKTGRRLGDVTVGPHYVFQLEHQIDKKTHVRGAGPDLPGSGAPKIHYDAQTKIPQSGGHTGAQSLGALGTYSALAANLHENLHEMQTIKSDQLQSHAAWAALTNGQLLPPPQTPFAYKKFEALLTGLGINVKNDGASVRLLPTNDAAIRARSNGALPRADMLIRGITDAPVKGGLFDPKVTGGMDGHGWAHIELPEPMPNPMFAESISAALGLKRGVLQEIIDGKQELHGKKGPRAIYDALSKLDRDKLLAASKTHLQKGKLTDSELNRTYHLVKSLEALKDANLSMKDGWALSVVPVLPPIYRPISNDPSGKMLLNPLNKLYRRLGSTVGQLQAATGQSYDSTLEARAGLYRELGNLFGTVPKGKKALDLDARGKEDPNKKLSGILHMISGESPKDGYFQKKLIGKKQDFTARATIISDPALGVDQMGLPKKVGLEMMRPIVVGRLVSTGYDRMQAEKMVSQEHPTAVKILENDLKTRPLLVKRDPVLHQYGLIAQNVHLTNDPAIRVNPLILPSIGGDVDGDTAAVMVPLSARAVEEAKRILPSNRPLAESSGDSLFAPTNESSLSLYRMTMLRGTPHKGEFESAAKAEAAFYANQIDLNTPIRVKGIDGPTTLGRIRVADVLPDSYRNTVLTAERPFDKGMQSQVMREIAKGHPPAVFARAADGLMHLGFQMAYESGHSVTLADLEPHREERDAIINKGKVEAAKLQARHATKDQITEHWKNITRQIHELYAQKHKERPTNVSDMAYGKIKAKTEQFQGLVMAPMLVEDHLGRPSDVPITKSFAEGIDVGGYFTQASGARRGTIQKTDSVREPGYMSKLLVQANIDQRITGNDCGTTHGISMSIKDRDVLDRFLAHPAVIGTHTYAPGTVVTPAMVNEAKLAKVDNLVVRSPLKCLRPQGVCAHCMGLHPNGQHYQHGENVGVVAAQSLGERAAQIMLKQTHGAGIVSLDPTVSDFEHVQRMFAAAKPSRSDAVIAKTDRKITDVKQTQGGFWSISYEGHKKPDSTTQAPLAHVKPGYVAKRGEVLTHGEPNIHDIADASGLEGVQQHMVNRIGGIYSREGVLRRHTELAVRSATSTVRVTDPGGHVGYIRGDRVFKPLVDHINASRTDLKPIKYVTELMGTSEIPERRQPDWMARLQSEGLAGSIIRAVQHGQTSHLDGQHPIPRLAAGRSTAPGHR